MSDLIRDRDERTRKRKKAKRRMDSIIGLSSDKEGTPLTLSAGTMKLADTTIRLLDEGYFDNGFVIKKGTLEKFLNGRNEKVRGYEMNEEGKWSRTDVLNLDSDFRGTVNLGHMDFSTFPYIIGEWKKEDLELVDIENDRSGLDVALHLDEESVFVKELKRQPYDIGVSAEFWYSINDEDTESLSQMLGEYMPVIDEIFIFAYGLVGECGNVNSSGLELKGEDMKDVNILEETVEETIEEPMEEPMEESAEEVNEETMEESVEEETVEEVIELSEEEEHEEADDEEADDEDGDEDESDEVDLSAVLDELNQTIETLKAEIEDLKAANAELKKNNRRLNGKLKDEKAKKEQFIEKAKGISIKLGVGEEKPKEDKATEKFAFGDGIGD